MGKLDPILSAVRGLSEAERRELLALLLADSLRDRDDDDAAIGARGLAAFTASVRNEDWSAFYPPELDNGRSSVP
jgi:hypothetical protein